MTGYWHHHIVCLSVCLSVTLCIVALGVGDGVQGTSCTSESVYQLYLFVRSDTFAVGCIV